MDNFDQLVNGIGIRSAEAAQFNRIASGEQVYSAGWLVQAMSPIHRLRVKKRNKPVHGDHERMIAVSACAKLPMIILKVGNRNNQS